MYTKRQIQTGNRRLLQLADELQGIRAARFVKSLQGMRGYDQSTIHHPCGSPACAWGHYVINDKRRRQRILKGLGDEDFYYDEVLGEGYVKLPVMAAADDEFALEEQERCELFESFGCGRAKSGTEAAKYIRNFVKNREKELG